MVLKSKPKIIIVDDNINDENDDFYIVELGLIYGKENILFFQNPTDAIAYIRNNLLTQRMIVILDVMFGNLPLGFKVFESITDKTSLVCFIIMTGNIEKISNDNLIKLINGHLWHIIKRDESTANILKVIQNAENQLAARIDGVLEEWINRHTKEDRAKPYLRTRAGKSYNLDNILEEIRRHSDFGKEMERGILNLTIDLLARQKEEL